MSKVNIRHFYESCGLDDAQIEQCCAITSVLFEGSDNNAEGAGVVLMSVMAFVVEIVRKGRKP